MVSNEERLRRRWWLYSNMDKLILNEVTFHRKFNVELKLPKQAIWSWDEEEVRTELDVDTR